jgi:hypothetical protein
MKTISESLTLRDEDEQTKSKVCEEAWLERNGSFE